MLAAANVKDDDGYYDLKASMAGYRNVFRDGGIDIETLPVETAAELICAKPKRIRETLAAFWTTGRGVPRRRLTRIACAQSPDADPDPYRLAIRDASQKNDLKALQLARDPQVESLPAFTLNRLAGAIYVQGDEGRCILKKAQRLHPRDFWLNKNLAGSLNRASQYNEAIHYHTVAVALRPTALAPIASSDMPWP